MKKKTYERLDYFRIIAAVMVVAIHTSPFITYSETADFIVTRIIARAAVPFFFMTSGFFLYPKYSIDWMKIKKFCWNTMKLYIVSIIVYIPINIYSGYFKQDHVLSRTIKELLFDGTFYHLWYLPAAILGALIAGTLIWKIGYKKALAVTVILYLIGLLGDSYYGLITSIKWVDNIYKNMFELFSYTRNGIFFAPIFFVLGGWLSKKTTKVTKNDIAGLGVTLSLMLMEGCILYHFQIQKHDSMYIFLVPCMYFLFSILIKAKENEGKNNIVEKKTKFIRLFSLVVYVIHPISIILVRGISKAIKLNKYLINNSVIHFLCVLLVSIIFAVFITIIILKLDKDKIIKNKLNNIDDDRMDRAWIELNLNLLKYNIRSLTDIMPEKCKLMAVVKAEAYGHGAAVTTQCLNQAGVEAFAVATIEEGINLRKIGISGEILILGYTAPKRSAEIYNYNLIQTAVSYEHASALNVSGYDLQIHLKIDTGMYRLGVLWDQWDQCLKIFRMKHLKIKGIYTHLCAADNLIDEDVDYTCLQINRFYILLEKLNENKIKIPKIHMQSSYGLLNYPELECDYVRIGIALYGAASNNNRINPKLYPVLSLKARVILIKDVNKGEGIGYGRTCFAKRDSKIAILPIGYADGLPRGLSDGAGQVLIQGKAVPIVGKVCMDHLTIDITDLEHVKVGDTATIIGINGEQEISALKFSSNQNSIPNEILSRMGGRLKIVEQQF